jgi:predicted aspartyl protease
MTRRRRLSILALLALLAGCAQAPPPVVAAAPVAANPTVLRVALKESGGVNYVMVGIDNVCCFPFMLDSGASDVSVSPDIFRALVKSGRVTEADLFDVVKYRTASGAVIEGLRFRMPPMTVGGRTVNGVIASVSKGADVMLLGQSFLKQFRFWAIDNRTGELVLG